MIKSSIKMKKVDYSNKIHEAFGRLENNVLFKPGDSDESILGLLKDVNNFFF